MEGSGNISGEQVGRDHPEVVDVETEDEARRGRAPDPVAVDQEAGEDENLAGSVEEEDHPLGDSDETGSATSMSQDAIEKARSKVLSYVDDGEIPGPSSALLSRNRDPPANMVHQSDEEVPGPGDDIRAPMESEGDGAKPRIVYTSNRDFSSLSNEEKLKLRDRLLRQISLLNEKCKFKEYKPRHSETPIQMENGFPTMMKKDENGILRKLIIKPAECRAADELKADPAFELPPNPTPTYLELLLKKLPAEHPNLPAEEVNSEEFQGPEWDFCTSDFVDEFCKKFNESMAFVNKECEDEKKAKEAARVLQKENRKKARDAILAQIEQCGGRRVTRLATGAITRKNTCEQSAQSPSASVQPGRQQRKRKVSEIGTSTGIEINPVPTLDRPLSQPERPLVLMEPSPPPPPPMPPSPEPGTSQADDEGLPSTCPLENSAGWCADNLWEVEEIVDVKVEKNTSTGKRRNVYKVKWRGWGREHNSWVPEEDILSKDPIKGFWSRLGSSQMNIEQDHEEEETRRQRSPSSTYFLP